MTLGIFPTMAPPHSACWPTTTFGLTLKVFSHRLKWGLMRSKASHTTINAEMLRIKVRGQIVEIQPVIEHETPDKWVEWKP